MSKIKLDLSKFKKVSTDAKSTTLKHPAGHEIRIAHSAVGPEMKKQLEALPHFDMGGAATDSPAYKLAHSKAFVNKQSSKPQVSSESQSGDNGEALHAEAVARYKSQQSNPDGYATGGRVPGRANYSDSDTPVSENDVFDPSPELKLNMGDPSNPTPQAPADPDAVNSALGENRNIPQTDAPPQPGQQPEGQPSPPAGQQPTPPQPNPSDPTQNPLSQPTSHNPLPTLGGSRDMQIAGAEGTAASLGGMDRENAKIYSRAQLNQQHMVSAFNEQLKSLQTEREQLTDDIKNQHIDPSRLFNNSNTFAKVGSVLGLVAGGIGGALTGHGGNAALDYLNKMTDQDIDAQKADLGKKENLLSANFRKFGDLKEATVMTKIMQADLVSQQLAEQAAKSQSALEKSRLLTLKGQIDQGMYPPFQALAALQASNKLAQDPNTDPAALVPLRVPKEEQPAAYKELKAAQDNKAMHDPIIQEYKNVVADYNKMGGLGRAEAMAIEPRSLQRLKLLMNTTVAKLTGTAREAEFKSVAENALPGKFSSNADLAKGLNALENYFKADYSAPVLKAYGLDVNKFKSTSMDPMSGLSPREQKWVEEAKRNPNHPVSKAILSRYKIQ